MISNKFSKSFFSFIQNNEKFSDNKKNKIIDIFKNKNIKVIFSISLYLILWSFGAAFFDTFFATRGVIFTFLNHSFLNSFLPSLIFIFINAILKFIFIYSYTKKRINIELKHIFIGVIPLVGSLLFSAYLLKNNLLFFSAMKDYFIFIKKDFKWFKILKEKSY